MFLRIEAIASYTGLKGIFKLKAADIYEVVSVEQSSEECGIKERWSPRGGRPDAVFTLQAMRDLTATIAAADSLESLLDSILTGLKVHFGFSHSMICLAVEKPNTLVTIASRGYAQGGAGAEVHFGEGIIGVVAEARKPIRISGLLRGMMYAYAVAKRAQERGLEARSPRAAARAREPHESARRAAGGARRSDRRALHRERDAVPLPRGRQGHDRAAWLTPRHRHPEHAAAGNRRSDGSATQRGPARARAGGANRESGASWPFTKTTKC